MARTAVLLLVAVALGWAPQPACAGGPARLEIVRRAIEHHGGDRYRHSETSLTLCSGSGCYAIVSRVDGGLYQHQVSGPYRGHTRRVQASNDSVDVWRDGQPMAVLPEVVQALRDWAMARVYFAFLPFRLEDPDVVQRDLGIEEWDGRRLHKVKVGFVAGTSTDADDEFLYWFDPASGRLEQFAYSFTGRPGGLRFRRLHNYRREGGILFFDQENLGVEGEGLSVDLVTPQFVRQRMRQVSKVTLSELSVRPLVAESTDSRPIGGLAGPPPG